MDRYLDKYYILTKESKKWRIKGILLSSPSIEQAELDLLYIVNNLMWPLRFELFYKKTYYHKRLTLNLLKEDYGVIFKEFTEDSIDTYSVYKLERNELFKKESKMECFIKVERNGN